MENFVFPDYINRDKIEEWLKSKSTIAKPNIRSRKSSFMTPEHFQKISHTLTKKVWMFCEKQRLLWCKENEMFQKASSNVSFFAAFLTMFLASKAKGESCDGTHLAVVQ